MGEAVRIIPPGLKPNRPGEPRRGGRLPGTLNHSTTQLKEAILEAATEAGNGSLVNYLRLQAMTNPQSFMSLLGKVLPMQVQGDVGGKLIIEWAKEPVKDA